MKLKIDISKPISSGRQTFLNLATSIVSYGLTFGVSFLLTPYIVSKLGAAAYGFIGLSNNIISYTTLLTVALNSMSTRFITVNYHADKIDNANRYFASTFFGNSAIALLIVLILGFCTLFLEKIINIPAELVNDVKFLFTLLFVNTSISLCFGVFNCGTFIKNRLDLSNFRGMIGKILNTIILIIAYGFFPAHVWYIGLAGLFYTFYYIYTNYRLLRVLTPELKVCRRHFRFSLLWEMTKTGSWNLLTSLGSMLNQGLELLLANIFVSAYFMGILSISKSLPWIILGFFAAIANTFQPEYIKHYAQGNMVELRKTLIRSIRILGLFTAIPCAIIFSMGDIFFASWLPNQDYNLLYCLMSITMFGIMFSMPTQALWYIFTMTKTVKRSSIVLIQYSIANFLIILCFMYILDNNLYKIIAISGTQAVMFMFRFTTFLPFYGAKVLGLPKYTLFWPIIKVVFSTAVLTAILLPIKYFFIHNYNWVSFIAGSCIALLLGIILNYYISLDSSDRKYIRTRILKLKS